MKLILISFLSLGFIAGNVDANAAATACTEADKAAGCKSLIVKYSKDKEGRHNKFVSSNFIECSGKVIKNERAPTDRESQYCIKADTIVAVGPDLTPINLAEQNIGNGLIITCAFVEMKTAKCDAQAL